MRNGVGFEIDKGGNILNATYKDDIITGKASLKNIDKSISINQLTYTSGDNKK